MLYADQLRDAQHARRAAAHSGRRRRADVRRQDYSIRIWLQPDKLAQLGLTPADVASAVREQNSQFAARPHRRRADAASRSTSPTPCTAQGRLAEARGVRADRRAHRRGRRDRAPEGRRARRARRAELQHLADAQRPADRADRRLPAAGRQRAADRRARAEAAWTSCKAEFPQGHDVHDSRTTRIAIREHLDRGSGQDAARSDGAGVPASCCCSCRTGAPRSSPCSRCRCR